MQLQPPQFITAVLHLLHSMLQHGRITSTPTCILQKLLCLFSAFKKKTQLIKLFHLPRSKEANYSINSERNPSMPVPEHFLEYG